MIWVKDYITQQFQIETKKSIQQLQSKIEVDSIQKGKPNVGAVEYVKELSTTHHKIFNRLYSTLRNKKFTKWKDVHNDIDSLVSESVNEDTDVGHQDDEPNMLKSTALEIMEYGKTDG